MGLKYTDALFQVGLVGFICFCCPGMFNVLNSIGGGGLLSNNVSKNANVALNVTFAIFGILGGGIVNAIGAKYSLAISGLGYVFYSASYLIYRAAGESGAWVVVFAGALLGMCAGVLWSAQGSIMMSYASENSKGFYISVFWIIFNLGPVLGSGIPFAFNFSTKSSGLSSGTYIGLIIVMTFGCLLSLALCPINRVRRDDGKPVVVTKYENVMREGLEVLKVFTDWKMLYLVPLFVASNWFYTYQFDLFNGAINNMRTRAFSNVWYWAMQMVGSLGMGRILDSQGMTRSRRGMVATLFLALCFTVTWACGFAFQLTYTRENNPYTLDAENPGIDFTSSTYAIPICLYMAYGTLDAMLQTLAYWVMGSLSSDSLVLTRYAGFYKGIQSAGGAISWAISTTSVSYLTQLIICWVLLELAIPGTLLVVRSLSDQMDESDAEFEGISKKDFA
ncbi:hypothetical protein DSO57_1035750 [Entomophthora muscae]|uniref:Uncharacterized protein n=1 Tax=Entomophthora muscae TaxID=34485 RepID=A0ACC2S1K6_9FUNG|nr:hypothetical protein DSO57_1035750 [Entomophthora muscae]